MCVAGLVRTLEHAWPSLLRSVIEPADADLFAYLQHDSPAVTAEQRSFANSTLCLVAASAVVEPAAPAPRSLLAKVAEQGRKIGRCLGLVEERLRGSQGRAPYALLLFSRPDVVFPQRPFPFEPLLAVASGDEQTPVPERSPPRSGVVFIPLCCDNKALTDMMAVGTWAGMRHYMSWGSEKWDEHVTGEQAVARHLQGPEEHGHIRVRRFWYEFALLRGGGIDLAMLRLLGQSTFTEYFHSAALNSFVVSNATPSTVVNASTECTFNPTVDVPPNVEYEMAGRDSRIQSRRSRLFGYPIGERRWQLSSMRCDYRPRTCAVDHERGAHMQAVCRAPDRSNASTNGSNELSRGPFVESKVSWNELAPQLLRRAGVTWIAR